MRTNQRAMIGGLLAMVLVLGMVAAPAGADSQEIVEVEEETMLQEAPDYTNCVTIYQNPPDVGVSPMGCVILILELLP